MNYHHYQPVTKYIWLALMLLTLVGLMGSSCAPKNLTEDEIKLSKTHEGRLLQGEREYQAVLNTALKWQSDGILTADEEATISDILAGAEASLDAARTAYEIGNVEQADKLLTGLTVLKRVLELFGE